MEWNKAYRIAGIMAGVLSLITLGWPMTLGILLFAILLWGTWNLTK